MYFRRFFSAFFSYSFLCCFLLSYCTKIPTSVIELNDRFLDVMDKGLWFVEVDDRGLYASGQYWLQRKDVVGRAKGFVPYVGMVTIIMNDYPKLKYSVLALLGLFVLLHRE